MDKGIFTNAQEKKLSELLDNVVKLKGIIELIDGYVFKVLITFLDDTFADKLSTDIKTKLAALADAVMNEDVDTAEQIVTDIVNSLVDIPGLDEEAEGLLFKGIVELLVGAVLSWINSVKKVTVRLSLVR